MVTYKVVKNYVTETFISLIMSKLEMFEIGGASCQEIL